ncbi:MAG: hypothetical protein COA70_05340 [Planctomycetota bacterium]|nr:MAG: hypothetical protein COA70_05340 [Planctomycetota bacterium]
MNKPSPWADAEPRRRWMPPEEFVLLLEKSGQAFLCASQSLRQQGWESWVEGSLSTLSREARTLEFFLDAHGARANQAFYPLRKSVACTLWLSEALSCLVHLRGRLEVYPSADEFWTRRRLPESLKETVGGLAEILLKTMEVLEGQWVAAGCNWDSSVLETPPQAILQSKILVADRAFPSDLKAGNQADHSIPAARLANRYLGFFNSWTVDDAKELDKEDGLIHFLEEFCRERTVRSFKARAHNWQSDYDSMVLGSPEEDKWPELRCLRGAMSQALHFLEAMVALSHVFERHRPGLATASVDPASVMLEAKPFLTLFVEGCVMAAFRSLEVGVDSAKGLLSVLVEETYIYVRLSDGVQLHARPLSLLVRLTQHHGLPISMSSDGVEASTASLMQLLLLSGQRPSTREFRFDGDAAVLEDIALLFEANLGEDGIDALPEELNYLKQ